ncbi:MAG: YafY family transcriptional regulator [Defluviitaleaceae bacterium]|nr:YafY family transcriptional regulator [Defluviitaleaceae bacterium]
MKIDRLMGILTVLLQSKQVTALELARRFEVSRRTISRDIDALCQAGIPIITQQGFGGGISIVEGFKLDKSVLTAAELGDLIAALRGIGSVGNETRIQRTLDKLGAGESAVISLPEPVVIDLASYYKTDLTAKIEAIKQAVLERRLISFDYYYSKGNDHRQIEPYFAVFKWADWYVFGFCTERQDWRIFKLNRLWNLLVTQTTFDLRDIPPDRRDFGNHWQGNHTLVAIFDKSVRYQLIETYGLDCYTETPEGLHFEVSFDNIDFYLSWLLSFGGKVKVLQPPELAEQIKTAAKNILKQYS